MKTRSNMTLQQFPMYYISLVVKSIKKVLDIGPNFCPIDLYFHPSPINTTTAALSTKIDINNNALTETA